MKAKAFAAASCILYGMAAMAGGDEFVSARYMRIDKPGKAETISFGQAYASGPGEYGHSLGKYAQKGQILPERIPDPWWEWDFGTARRLSYVEIQPDLREGHGGDLSRKVVRGGSFNDRQLKATSSWRWGYPKWMRPFDVGFRIIVED